MKLFVSLLIFILSASFVSAENLFQSNNPFPQTVPQTMNNIYESEPAVMQKEEQKAKKSFFKRKNNLKKSNNSSDYIVPESKIIDSTEDGSFYVFK